MKKFAFLLSVMFIAAGTANAATMQDVYEALYTCSDANIAFSNGVVKIHEVGPGSCSYVSTFNSRTTACSMPTSMARKLAIFKTADALNEAQVADMKDIENKYCKTK